MTSRIQKALFLRSKCGIFEAAETKIPRSGPGEVLSKVKAAALNPVYWKFRNMLAGDIEEVREGVEDLKKGARVHVLLLALTFCHSDCVPEKAAYQQYTIALAVTTVKIPGGFFYNEMSAIPLSILTHAACLRSAPHSFTSVTTCENF
ncbi:hypothetical protein BJ165DRAFT_1408322 [Panaeolus papilionaceus]|nr:hypothetical protein BJ165DRAFT_1408322 [Panaeolus papilionaceus]